MNNFLIKNKHYRSAIVIALLSASSTMMAAAEGSTSSFGSTGRYMLVAAIIIVGIWAANSILKVIDAVLRSRELNIYEKHGLQQYIDAKNAAEGSFFHKLKRAATNSVPIEKEGDILLGHNYDGIKELDNNLPPWWLYCFYFTIVIAIFYMGYYHVFNLGDSSIEEYDKQIVTAQLAVDKYLERQANQIDENDLELLVSESDLAAGKEIFQMNCIACHLESGGGSPTSVGPNLTDKYWVHGGGIQNVYKTVKNGVPEKGMISWQTQMNAGDMHKVSSYILSLQGTNPPNAKDPEGEEYIAAEVVEKAEVTEE